MKILAIFRCFKLNLGVIIASAEDASENLGYSTREQHNYDMIISKFQGGA